MPPRIHPSSKIIAHEWPSAWRFFIESPTAAIYQQQHASADRWRSATVEITSRSC
jgi:hypothetical protein